MLSEETAPLKYFVDDQHELDLSSYQRGRSASTSAPEYDRGKDPSAVNINILHDQLYSSGSVISFIKCIQIYLPPELI